MKTAIAASVAIALLSGCASQKVSVDDKEISVESSGTSLFYDIKALENRGRSVIETWCESSALDTKMTAGELVAVVKNARGFTDMLFPVNTVRITAACVRKSQ